MKYKYVLNPEDSNVVLATLEIRDGCLCLHFDEEHVATFDENMMLYWINSAYTGNWRESK